MIWVTCLDTGVKCGYIAKTPYEAISKALYTKNLHRFDKEAEIKLTKSGKHYYFDHTGKTYAVAVK